MKIRIIFDNNNPEALESTLILTKNMAQLQISVAYFCSIGLYFLV